MNSLLERIAADERRSGLAAPRQAERALQLLEWPRVLEQIAGFCHNRLAAEQVRRRLPYREREPIELQWLLADELRPLGETGRWPPLSDVSKLVAILASPPPLQLAGEELVHVAAVTVGLDELRDHFCRGRALFPLWGAAAIQLAAFGSLAGFIQRALGRDGQLLDSASGLLGRLRRAAKGREQVVRQAVAQAMTEARRRGWTTGDEVTLRGDRFCLPLRSGSRRQVPGIVHARSVSGGTHFVEPAAVVQLHNELAELRQDVLAEEARILLELNQAVEAATPALQEACRFLLLVDQVRAGLLWSQKYAGRRPVLAARGRLRIRRGRHPLLLQFGPGGMAAAASDSEASGELGVEAGAEAGGEAGAETAVDTVPALSPPSAATLPDRPPGPTEVIPLDLELPADKRVIVLSGPNAGGKSVALKTVGVCILLAQCGWDVPAREDTELPLVGKLFVDLGDEQSIEKSLSSFSAHLGNLVEFLAGADADSLVLCDEIGGGTDPQEGTALAFTVLTGLARRGSMVLASTHFGLLKAAVHDHADMINAAMDYDEETLRPLFTFRLGVPGASHAFDIAGRWGFPSGLLEQARSLVGEERFQIERLLAELAGRARALAATQAEAQERAESLARQEQDLAERLAQIDRERRQELERARHEGEQLLSEGRRTIERVVRQLRSSGGSKLVIRRAKDALDDLGRRLPPEAPPPATRVELQPGQDIHIPHLGLTGQILEIRGDKIVAVAAGMRLTLSKAAITPQEDERTAPEETTTRPGQQGGWRWLDGPPEVRHEIDVRGERGEEAWQQVDQLIDRAIPVGLAEILVVHGIGTGRLRDYLHEQLAVDRRVASWTDAPVGRGGHGATLIHLAGADAPDSV